MEANPESANATGSVATYLAKRNFTNTPEPSGVTVPPPLNGRRYVVQRHRARRLHYDLRLEMNGVLASWAVPKGPSMDSSVRRLAIHVEDHPLDYFEFEGVIPTGNYGAGDVIVWDWGTWAPGHDEDPAEAVRAGELHVDLYGQKLSGRFVLIRSEQKQHRSSRQRSSSARDQWLMIRKRDQAAMPGWNAEDFPRSVKTGLTNDELSSRYSEPDGESENTNDASSARTADLRASAMP